MLLMQRPEDLQTASPVQKHNKTCQRTQIEQTVQPPITGTTHKPDERGMGVNTATTRAQRDQDRQFLHKTLAGQTRAPAHKQVQIITKPRRPARWCLGCGPSWATLFGSEKCVEACRRLQTCSRLPPILPFFVQCTTGSPWG